MQLSGQVHSQTWLRDPLFLVRAQVIRLIRDVKMYQWKEIQTDHTTTHSDGSQSHETVYSYKKVWSQRALESSRYQRPKGHQNPAMPYSSLSFTAKAVQLGAFKLSPKFINQIPKRAPLALTQAQIEKINLKLKTAFKLMGVAAGTGEVAQPKIGDLRVSFRVIQPQLVSVMAQQYNGELRPYISPHGKVAILSAGQKGAVAMLEQATLHNQIKTWLIRVGCALMVWLGLFLSLRPLRGWSLIRLLLKQAPLWRCGILTLIMMSQITAVTWMAVNSYVSMGLWGFSAVLLLSLLAGRSSVKPSRKTVAMDSTARGDNESDTDPDEQNDTFIKR